MDESLKPILKAEAEKIDRSINWVINDILQKALKKTSRDQNTKKTEVKTASVINVPDYIDGQLWLDFIECRKKLKAPATDRAHKLLLDKLESMYQRGIDPNVALSASIENGWKGVFEPKGTAISHNVALGDW
jgi:hypothetical protein